MNLLSRLHLVVRSSLFWMSCGIAALSFTAYSQSLDNLGYQSWSTENGLPQNSVHQVFQSTDGYIWIATEGGVARFNGIDFKVFNHETTDEITSDDICCFAQSHTGPLWIATSDGLLQYSAGTFHRYSTANGLPTSRITNLAAAEDGTLLILTSDGLVSFDGQHFATLSLPSSASPSAITTARDGSVWIASNSGIFQYQSGRVLPQPLSSPPTQKDITGIGFFPDRSLWLRTGTSITILQNGQSHTLPIRRDLPAARIQSFLVDSRGQLWIGTSKGLFTLDNISSHPQAVPALSSDSILSLMQDEEGNLWVGTETSGLQILRHKNFRAIPALFGLPITAITQASDGALWAGTSSDGLDRWQAGTVQHLSTHTGLLSETILALAPEENGSMWVGTPDGLNYINGAKIRTYTSADGLPDDLVRSLLSDDDGSLWIGTRRGLAHWQNNQFVTLTQTDGLGSDLVGALLRTHAPSEHDLWIGTLNGLSRLRGSTITTFTTKDGLSGNTITSLAEDPHGTLWIGTKATGLSVMSTTGFTSLHRDDLPQTIDSILEDARGDLWLSSGRGITRVSASALIKCGSSSTCDPHPVSYGRADGMPTEEAFGAGHPSAWRTAEGLLLFATRKGVAVTDPVHLIENLIPPPVVIEQFTVDGVKIPLRAAKKNIAPGHTSFAFEYAGLSYVAPAKIRYRYILEGFDKQWTEAGSRRIAYYTNLPPRHYRFRVQAANNDGVWNEIGAQIAFSVQPPFYRTLWFLLLLLFLIATIALLLYRLRVRRLESQFQAVLAERTRVAREIHDTLAQSFVGISVQLELTSQLLAQSQVSAASQQIDRTRTYVREGLADARRSIWNLRAITAQNSLPTRLTHLAELWNQKKLNTRLNISGTYRPLAQSFEDEIFRIAQESLANAARHANATQVSADLNYNSTRLTLSISDNGSGFSLIEGYLPSNGHFGIKGMHERAAQIHARLTIKSSPEDGTTVTLEAPIAEGKETATHG
ncbi:sensor histidine kinase [Tunturibacter empetritectus]|uniref:Ligand-binding sensor domain-containing protein/signal transduction histidine kinase n=2 Tax=Tunturiibacter empetritectus TaxID=3069691 RepID=A0A7W8IIJ3_9BACT|nr:sensor histidine kinase [Edaphobacter lichenicola]MBB5316965.1 ligand-binding sensor domain-containing protein/signal transduction histidine kinase [Edaphobacter lichenicola]